MDIQEFHQSIRELINIGQGQYYPPESIDIQINTAIKDLYRQEYTKFESTQQISDTLGYYKERSVPIVLTTGKISLPNDFYHLTGVDVVLDSNDLIECEVLKDSHWQKRRDSKGYPPSDKYPIARQMGSSKVELLPSTINKAIIFYLRKPIEVKFGYDLSTDGTSWVYNETKSNQIDWPEIDHPRIQDKVLGLLGISLRDQDLLRQESIKKSQNENA